MGNFMSFQFGDDTLNRIITCICGKGYIRNLKKNLMALEREMEDLKAIQLDVQNKVAVEETQHRQRLEVVQVWFTRVECINTRFNDLVSTSLFQVQRLFIWDYCSKNVCSSYNYGKSVLELLEDVKILKSEGDFEEVAEDILTFEVVERPTRPTVGQEVMFEKTWNRIMDDGVGIIGLHGMGGVGKTTLFERLHNKMDGMFDTVIWVVVSQTVEISKLQDDIAQKLHLCDERWTNQNEYGKAADIHKVLKGKRFVLMLDDLWEKVELEAIGIPFPTKENGCKVTFTTRSQEICGRMGDHEPMKINCLEQGEAWELFENKIGDNTLRDLDIVSLLEKLLINVVVCNSA